MFYSSHFFNAFFQGAGQRQFVRQVAVAFKRYLESHLAIKAEFYKSAAKYLIS